MSQYAVELCALLVDETYGELASRIFTILLRRGRLTIRLLKDHTQLSQRQLRHGLAVLIQQNLIYYFYEEEVEATFYEANQAAAYGLVRSGKYIEIAETKYGVLGKTLVQNLLLLGQATVANLIDSCQAEKAQHHSISFGDNLKEKEKEQEKESGDEGSKNDSRTKSNGVSISNGVNGNSNRGAFSLQLENTLSKLCEDGFVEVVTIQSFRSPTDTRKEIERNLLRETYGGSTKGSKQKDELEVRVREQLRDLRSASEKRKLNGKKRPFNGDSHVTNGNAKRQKLSSSEIKVNGTHNQENEGTEPERELLLRIKHEKFTVILRNDRLVEFVHDRIGETTSHIYAEILRLMEEGILRCQIDPMIDDPDDPPYGPLVTTVELAAALSSTIDVTSGIGKIPAGLVDTPSADRSEKSPKIEPKTNGTVSSNESESEDEAHDLNGNGNIPDVVEDSDSSHSDELFISELTGKESNGTKGRKQPQATLNNKDKPAGKEVEGIVKELKPAKATLNNDDEPAGKGTKAATKGVKRTRFTLDDNDNSSSKRSKHATSDDEITSSDENRLFHLKNHLQLLASHEFQFLRRTGNNGKGEWTVDFGPLVEHLKESEVNFILKDNFGPEGHRLVRMMRKIGKLDEKGLYQVALINQRDLRTKLAEMQMAGMVEVQCIPRDTAHTVARSIFLWHFDPDRVSALLLDKFYKAMTKCIQRLEIERRRADGILSLAARSDVKNNEAEVLNGEQLNLLQNFRDKEDMILGQVARIDELVGMFRDY